MIGTETLKQSLAGPKKKGNDLMYRAPMLTLNMQKKEASNLGTRKECRWIHSTKQEFLLTVQSSEHQSKNDNGQLPLIPQHLLTSQNPIGSISNVMNLFQ